MGTHAYFVFFLLFVCPKFIHCSKPSQILIPINSVKTASFFDKTKGWSYSSLKFQKKIKLKYFFRFLYSMLWDKWSLQWFSWWEPLNVIHFPKTCSRHLPCSFILSKGYHSDDSWQSLYNTGKHLYISLQKEAVSQLKEHNIAWQVRTQNEEIVFYWLASNWCFLNMVIRTNLAQWVLFFGDCHSVVKILSLLFLCSTLAVFKVNKKWHSGPFSLILSIGNWLDWEKRLLHTRIVQCG